MKQTVTVYQIIDYLKTKKDLTEAELELQKWNDGVYTFDETDPYDEEYFLEYAIRRAMDQDSNFSKWMRGKVLIISHR